MGYRDKHQPSTALPSVADIEAALKSVLGAPMLAHLKNNCALDHEVDELAKGLFSYTDFAAGLMESLHAVSGQLALEKPPGILKTFSMLSEAERYALVDHTTDAMKQRQGFGKQL